MRLDVEIGSTTQSWTLGSDDSLDAWLRRCPWRGGEVSQLRTLRLASRDEASPIASEIRGLIYAADSGVYLPQVFLHVASPEEGMIALLSACIFGEPRSLDRLKLKRLLFDRLEQAPQIFLLHEAGDQTLLLEELRGLLEEINRQGSVYPLLLMVFGESRSLAQRPDCFDTRPAMPSSRVLSPYEFDPHALWGRYLHLRAAWESGGDLHQAWIYGSAWKMIQPFDDGAVETSCSSIATRRWSAIDVRIRSKLEQYLAQSCLPARSDGYGDQVVDLLEAGLLWQTQSHCRPTPTAWVARATAGLPLRNSVLQRAALVVSPLVAELVTWCFQLEALERARYRDTSSEDVEEETKDLYAKFVERKTQPPASMYPQNYPLSLATFDFESLGAFFNRFTKNRRTRSRKLLLDVRNALCHGHNAGWKTIEDLLLIRAELDPFR